MEDRRNCKQEVNIKIQCILYFKALAEFTQHVVLIKANKVIESI